MTKKDMIQKILETKAELRAELDAEKESLAIFRNMEGMEKLVANTERRIDRIRGQWVKFYDLCNDLGIN